GRSMLRPLDVMLVLIPRLARSSRIPRYSECRPFSPTPRFIEAAGTASHTRRTSARVSRLTNMSGRQQCAQRRLHSLVSPIPSENAVVTPTLPTAPNDHVWSADGVTAMLNYARVGRSATGRGVVPGDAPRGESRGRWAVSKGRQRGADMSVMMADRDAHSAPDFAPGSSTAPGRHGGWLSA